MQIAAPSDGERRKQGLTVLATLLANERTLLAWIRTCATLITLGVTIDTFVIRSSKWVALAFAVVGLLGAVVGTVRYWQVQAFIYPLSPAAVAGQRGFGRIGMRWLIIPLVLTFLVVITFFVLNSIDNNVIHPKTVALRNIELALRSLQEPNPGNVAHGAAPAPAMTAAMAHPARATVTDRPL